MDLINWIIPIVTSLLLGGVLIAALWGRLVRRTECALSYFGRKLGLSKRGPASGSDLFSDDK